MKKVMLLIVGMLLSFSASAATLTLSGAGSSSNATQSAVSINNNLVIGSGFALIPDGTSDVWYSWFDLTTDVDTDAIVEWSFNPEDAVSLATLTIGTLAGGFLDSWDVVGDFAVSYFFLASETYTIDFQSVTSSGLGYDVSVSAVPVPAALFLFAPALLGFFGLRRKAALAA